MDVGGGSAQSTHLRYTRKSIDEQTHVHAPQFAPTATHIHSLQHDSARDHDHVSVTTTTTININAQTTIRQLEQQIQLRTRIPTTPQLFTHASKQHHDDPAPRPASHIDRRPRSKESKDRRHRHQTNFDGGAYKTANQVWRCAIQHHNTMINGPTTGLGLIDITTTLSSQPTQHEVDHPLTNQIEGDQRVCCRSEGGHFGSMPQTQQPRLVNRCERDDEATTTRPVPINSSATRPVPNNHDNTTQLVLSKHAQQVRLDSHSGRNGDVSTNNMMTQLRQLTQHNAEDNHTLRRRHSQRGGKGKTQLHNATTTNNVDPRHSTQHTTRQSEHHAQTQQQTSRNDHNHDGQEKHTCDDKRRQDPRAHPRVE